jgi:transposase InsO family protein
MLICVCLRILASSRIPRYDLGRQTPYFWGGSVTIVYARGTQFTLRFWERLHETLDSQLWFSSAYHPQTNGQTERVNHILQDMLRACALQYGRGWDKSLPYAEFSYNNSYQKSLKIAPFEMLYGRRCWTLLFWNEKPRSKFAWLGRTFESRNQDKRAMPIVGGEN